jgi:hypothetical protein
LPGEDGAMTVNFRMLAKPQRYHHRAGARHREKDESALHGCCAPEGESGRAAFKGNAIRRMVLTCPEPRSSTASPMVDLNSPSGEAVGQFLCGSGLGEAVPGGNGVGPPVELRDAARCLAWTRPSGRTPRAGSAACNLSLFPRSAHR